MTPKTDSSWARLLHRALRVLDILQSSPGHRFQERYRRRSSTERGRVTRCLVVLAGIVLTLAGVFFLAVPGPGIPILAVGLALIAQESAAAARLLDRTEVWVRRRFSYKGRGSRTR